MTQLPSALVLLAVCLLFSPTARAGGKELDRSTYEAPLYEQVVAHLRAKVAARLGEGKQKADRYFIIPFAYENDDNNPEFSHSFMTVIRVFAHNAPSARDTGFRTGSYKQWKFEAFTISWLPHDFDQNSNLCVFNGIGGRIFPSWNACPLSNGRSFDLAQTLQLAVKAHVAVGMWGPYEISKEGFDIAVKRLRLLQSGTIKYRADDRLQRKDRVAINCFHAMGGLEELYPNGGLFGTGFKMWGLNGTRRVLIEYNQRGRERGLLLEPANPKEDLYGFVYAPEAGSRRVYNPFTKASVYHR